MKKKIWVFLVLIIYSSGTVLAEEYYHPLRSPRSLAMGNTGVSAANDSYALSYNPAVLANTKKWWVDFAAWNVGGTKGYTALDVLPSIAQIKYPYIKETGLASASLKSFLAKTDPHMRASAGVNFVGHLGEEGLAIGANYLREVTIQGINNNTQIFQRNDRVSQYGMSLPLAQGRFILGLGLRRIDRRDATSDATVVPVFPKQYQRGQAYDIGILWRMANAARISWGLVVQNYGGMTIGTQKDAEPQEVHLGVNMDFEFGIFKLVPTIDVKGVQTTRKRKNRVHAGAELGLFPNETGGNFLSFRVGSNQGYASSGAEVNIGNHGMIFGVTRYYEEIGTTTKKQQSAQRLLGYFSLGF